MRTRRTVRTLLDVMCVLIVGGQTLRSQEKAVPVSNAEILAPDNVWVPAAGE